MHRARDVVKIIDNEIEGSVAQVVDFHRIGNVAGSGYGIHAIIGRSDNAGIANFYQNAFEFFC